MKKFLQVCSVGVLIVLSVGAAVASQIAIPNQFIAGGTARASEVNQNFAALVEESNAQDILITAQATQIDSLTTALAAPTEQLVCHVIGSWVVTPGGKQVQYSNTGCVSSLAPLVVVHLSFAEVLDEGWWLVSVGGADNRETYIFRR